MPNYCSNYVELRHKDPARLQAAADAWNSGELFNSLMPRPESLNITACHATNDRDLKVLYDANIEAHGYANWYDYNLAEWGTKWDVGRGEHEEPCSPQDDVVILNFDSAWSPPLEAWDNLSAQGYEIMSYYYEPGMGFCGRYHSDGSGEHYDISSVDPLDIPQDLDEFFGISESRREWEEDRREGEDSNFEKEQA